MQDPQPRASRRRLVLHAGVGLLLDDAAQRVDPLGGHRGDSRQRFGLGEAGEHFQSGKNFRQQEQARRRGVEMRGLHRRGKIFWYPRMREGWGNCGEQRRIGV